MIEENKILISCFFEEAFNQQDFTAAREIVHEQFIIHTCPPHSDPLLVAMHLSPYVYDMHAALGLLYFTIQDQIAEHDKVVTRYIANSVHHSPFLGIVAAGNQVNWSSISIHRIEDDLIVESWVDADLLGLKQQLTNTTYTPTL